MQELDNRFPTLSIVIGGFTLKISRTYVCTVLQKQPNASFVAMLACIVESCRTFFRYSANAGTMLQKQPNASFVPIQACMMESCSTIICNSAYIGTMLK